MSKLSGFQRLIVGAAAIAVALRAFFPVSTYSGVLLAPTLLQIVGILVVAAAVFVLFPSPQWRTVRRWSVAVALIAGWLFYVPIAYIGLSTLDLTTSWDKANWRGAALATGGFLILATFTWLWVMARSQRALTSRTKALVASSLVIALFSVTLPFLFPMRVQQRSQPSPRETVNPEGITNIRPIVPEPTLSELADSMIVHSASWVLDVYRVGTRTTFQELNPSDKDSLCAAGKAIRNSMRFYHKTRNDLNYTLGAIFDTTAPAGRCR